MRLLGQGYGKMKALSASLALLLAGFATMHCRVDGRRLFPPAGLPPRGVADMVTFTYDPCKETAK